MKITKSTVDKIKITDVFGFDSVNLLIKRCIGDRFALETFFCEADKEDCFLFGDDFDD